MNIFNNKRWPNISLKAESSPPIIFSFSLESIYFDVFLYDIKADYYYQSIYTSLMVNELLNRIYQIKFYQLYTHDSP